MRRISILFLSCMLAVAANAQTQYASLPIDSSTGKISFSEIIPVDSAPANKLFSSVKLFIADYFKEPKQVTQLVDESNNTIIVDAMWQSSSLFPILRYTSYVKFHLTVQCKDNKYRYVLTNLAYEDMDGNNIAFPLESDMKLKKKQDQDCWNAILKGANMYSTNLIAELKKHMAVQNDNW